MTYKHDKYSHTRPNVGVTITPFIYKDGKIKVLLYKRSKNAEVFKNQFCLPNRFFDITEFNTAEDAANFALEEKTNVKIPHLTQFKTFSGLEIDPSRIATVNICYYSILREDEVFSIEKEQPFETYWVDVEKALNEDLAFNHNEVLELAYKRLKASAEYTAEPVHFLPVKFTISELRELTSLLIGQNLDNSRYRDRIKKSGVLTECVGERRKSANRPPQLYTYNYEYEGFFYPKSLTKHS